MRIRDIIYYLRSDINLIIRECDKDGKTIDIYNGQVQNLPYWIAELEFVAEKCIEAETDSIVIGVGKPVRGITNNDIETNQKWLNTLNEEDTLLGLAGYLYHYDVGVTHNDPYDQSEWDDVFEPMIDYIEERINSMSFDEKMQDWYRDIPFKK